MHAGLLFSPWIGSSTALPSGLYMRSACQSAMGSMSEAVRCDRALSSATKPGRKAHYRRFHSGADPSFAWHRAEHGGSVSLADISHRTADAGPMSRLSLALSRDSPRSGLRHGFGSSFSRSGAIPSHAAPPNLSGREAGTVPGQLVLALLVDRRALTERLCEPGCCLLSHLDMASEAWIDLPPRCFVTKPGFFQSFLKPGLHRHSFIFAGRSMPL